MTPVPPLVVRVPCPPAGPAHRCRRRLRRVPRRSRPVPGRPHGRAGPPGRPKAPAPDPPRARCPRGPRRPRAPARPPCTEATDHPGRGRADGAVRRFPYWLDFAVALPVLVTTLPASSRRPQGTCPGDVPRGRAQAIGQEPSHGPPRQVLLPADAEEGDRESRDPEERTTTVDLPVPAGGRGPELPDVKAVPRDVLSKGEEPGWPGAPVQLAHQLQFLGARGTPQGRRCSPAGHGKHSLVGTAAGRCGRPGARRYRRLTHDGHRLSGRAPRLRSPVTGRLVPRRAFRAMPRRTGRATG